MKQFGPVEAGKEVRSTTVCSHFNKRHVYNTTCRKNQTSQILKNEGKTSTAEGLSCFKIHMFPCFGFFSGDFFCYLQVVKLFELPGYFLFHYLAAHDGPGL